MEDKVLEIASQNFGFPKTEIAVAMEVRKDFNATEVEVSDFFLQLEKSFAVTISRSEAEELKTIGDVVAFIQDHVEDVT